MRGTRLYAAAIVLLLMAVFAVTQHMPRRFAWEPTYSTSDRQPLGAYVFDRIMSQAMPRGYAVCRKSLMQIAADSSLRHSNLLIVSRWYDMSTIDFDVMDSLLREGANVMIATTGYNTTTTDSILAYDYGMALTYEDSFTHDSIKAWFNTSHNKHHDNVRWLGGDGTFGERRFDMPSAMVSAHIYTDDATGHTVRAMATCRVGQTYHDESSEYFREHADSLRKLRNSPNADDNAITDYIRSTDGHTDFSTPSDVPIAVSRKVGRGCLYMVSTPMVFTNYAVLDNRISPYLMRLMSHLADKPVVRTTCYEWNASNADADSPLGIVLGNRQLRAAYYMLWLTLLLFCIFKARRRQRIIPVVGEPRNHSLEFAMLIGTLYYQRGDHANLVRKRYVLLAEQVRARLHADIMGLPADDGTLSLLARHTGMERPLLEKQLARLRRDCQCEGRLPGKEMVWAIDCMEDIASKL